MFCEEKSYQRRRKGFEIEIVITDIYCLVWNLGFRCQKKKNWKFTSLSVASNANIFLQGMTSYRLAEERNGCPGTHKNGLSVSRQLRTVIFFYENLYWTFQTSSVIYWLFLILIPSSLSSRPYLVFLLLCSSFDGCRVLWRCRKPRNEPINVTCKWLQVLETRWLDPSSFPARIMSCKN